jgi:hypothetical protein
LNGLVWWAFNIRDGGLLKIIVFTDLKNTPEKTQHFAGHDRRLDGLGKPRLHHQENDQLRFDLLISGASNGQVLPCSSTTSNWHVRQQGGRKILTFGATQKFHDK